MIALIEMSVMKYCRSKMEIKPLRTNPRREGSAYENLFDR